MDINDYKEMILQHNDTGSRIDKQSQKSNEKIISSNTNLKKVLILSKVNCDSGAGGTRISNLIKLFNSTQEYYTSAYVFSDNYDNDNEFGFTEFSKYVSLGNCEKVSSKTKKLRMLFYGRKKVLSIIKKENPNIIFIYSVLSIFNIKFIKRYCERNKIKLIFDVVEFRQLFSSLSPFAFFGYNLHNYLISAHYINKKTNGVICPTFFLKKHFEEKRNVKNVFLFPITMDVDNMPKYNKNNSIDRIVYLYAGNPHKKRDLLINMIKAFIALPDSMKEKVLLIVCGVSAEKLIKEEKMSRKDYEDSLTFTLYLGSLPKSVLMKIYPNIDYSILLKNPKKRFSKAGFPTKMAECFSCGVPMVANLSGDMKYYMEDMNNSIVCKSTSVEDYLNSIISSINVYERKHTELSNNALSTAKERLDNHCYFDSFAIFIKRIIGE